MIQHRMTQTGLGRMPHIGSNVVDEKAVKLIERLDQADAEVKDKGTPPVNAGKWVEWEGTDGGRPMNAIRIRKKLDSDTLHLPELQPLVGKNVEIIVLEETTHYPSTGRPTATTLSSPW